MWPTGTKYYLSFDKLECENPEGLSQQPPMMWHCEHFSMISTDNDQEFSTTIFPMLRVVLHILSTHLKDELGTVETFSR